MTQAGKKESVWDYPRPPRWERCSREVRVVLAGREIARSTRSIRVLETSHPPTYYIPPEDIEEGVLAPSKRRSFCEWKGRAKFYRAIVGDRVVEDAAWSYPQPTEAFSVLRDHVAFYAHLMDACYVDGEQVEAQLGGFYGGWVTSDIVGPFKGAPGTQGW